LVELPIPAEYTAWNYPNYVIANEDGSIKVTGKTVSLEGEFGEYVNSGAYAFAALNKSVENLPINVQADEVRKVKRSESVIIDKPFTLSPNLKVSDAIKLMRSKNISSIPITKSSKLVGILTGALNISKRKALMMMNEVFNVPMSLGGLSNCEEQTSNSFAAPYDEAVEHIRGQDAAHADETGWRRGNLSKGWLESGNDPLREYQVLLEKYDEITAQWIIDQQYKHYKKLVLVAHSQEDLEKYRPRALEVAKFCKRWSFTYEEILGSDRYINNLLKAIEVVPKPDDDFIVVHPGGQIRQNEYFRQR
jgi:hypothetical protein